MPVPEVVPKDGVRRRFHALSGEKKLHVTLHNARFARARAIVVSPGLTDLQAELESDNLSAFTARVQVIENGQERVVEVLMNNGTGSLRIGGSTRVGIRYAFVFVFVFAFGRTRTDESENENEIENVTTTSPGPALSVPPILSPRHPRSVCHPALPSGFD